MQPERSKLGPRRLLLVTFVVFFLPVLAAWLLNVLAPGWLPFGTVNHGTLVQPVRAIASSGLVGLDGRAVDEDYLRGRWTLVQVIRAPCDRDCLDALLRTRQVRRALGEDIDRTQHLAVLAAPAFAADFGELELSCAVADDRWLASFDFGEAGASTSLYLIDPQGYLMMRFAADVDQHGLLADLERLLKISKIG